MEKNEKQLEQGGETSQEKETTLTHQDMKLDDFIYLNSVQIVGIPV